MKRIGTYISILLIGCLLSSGMNVGRDIISSFSTAENLLENVEEFDEDLNDFPDPFNNVRKHQRRKSSNHNPYSGHNLSQSAVKHVHDSRSKTFNENSYILCRKDYVRLLHKLII